MNPLCMCVRVYMCTLMCPFSFLLGLFVVKTEISDHLILPVVLKMSDTLFKTMESLLSKCFSLLQSLGCFILPKLATSHREKKIAPCLG